MSMRFLSVSFLLVLSLFSVSAEPVTLTAAQWQNLKEELQTLRIYYEKNESLQEERRTEYLERLSELQKRKSLLSERETDLQQRETDLLLKESLLEKRESHLTELTDLSERLKKRIEILERDNTVFKVLSIVGGIGSASGWAAFGLK